MTSNYSETESILIHSCWSTYKRQQSHGLLSGITNSSQSECEFEVSTRLLTENFDYLSDCMDDYMSISNDDSNAITCKMTLNRIPIKASYVLLVLRLSADGKVHPKDVQHISIDCISQKDNSEIFTQNIVQIGKWIQVIVPFLAHRINQKQWDFEKIEISGDKTTTDEILITRIKQMRKNKG